MRQYFNQFPAGFKHILFSQAYFNMGFFSLKALFILYTLHQFNIDQTASFELFSAFMTLCYATSFFGSFIADKIMGPQQTLIWGGVLATVGVTLFCVPYLEFLYISMALISLGSGCFKPNFSTALSLMFKNPQDDQKRAAFSVLYMAMNIGALAGILMISFLKTQDNWYYSLIFVALNFVLSAISFYNLPQPLRPAHLGNKLGRFTNIVFGFLIIMVLIVIIYSLFKNIASFNHMMKLIIVTSSLYFGYIFYQCNRIERRNLSKLLIYYVLFIFSCSLIEQEYSSLMVFLQEKVDRQIFGITIPATLFMTVNPVLVLVFGSMSSVLIKLDKYGKNNADLIKFTLGYGFLSASFGILAISQQFSEQGYVSVLWILGSFTLQTIGEWLIVPVGFAIASKYAPVRYLSVIMSFWLMGIAYAHLIAGKLAHWSLHSFDTNLMTDSGNYSQFFNYLFIASGIVFMVLVLNQLRVTMTARSIH